MSGTFMAYCDACRRVHAFPRDMAQPAHESRLMLGLTVVGHVLATLIIVAAIGMALVWWLTR